MTATLNEADRLIEIHREHPVKAMIGFHRRFGNPEIRLLEITQSGLPGEILAVQVTHNFNDESRAEVSGYLSKTGDRLGGVIYEYLSHEIDFLRFLFPDSTIKSIQSRRLSKRHQDDTAVIQFELSGNILVSYLLCSATTDYEEYRIFGTNGQVIFNRYRNSMPVFYSREVLANRPRRLISEWIDGLKSIALVKYGIKKNIIQAYIAEVEHFMQCIGDDTRPSCSLEEGKYVMEILERIYSAD